MATNRRTYPNDYFAWYNDDNRLAVVYRVLSSDSESKVEDAFDTYVNADVTNGIRIHYHSKYTAVSTPSDDLTSGAGVDSGLHPAIVDYVKARLLEDSGDVQRASYFRQKYEKSVKQYPHRKTGVRNLAVSNLQENKWLQVGLQKQ